MFPIEEIWAESVVIRPLQDGDLSFYARLNADEGFSNFLSSVPSDRVKAAFLRDQANSRESGVGLRAICDRRSGNLVGLIGIKEENEVPEIYGAADSSQRKKHYSSEAIRALISTLKAETKFKKVVAVVDNDNCAGIRTVESVGFRSEGEQWDSIRNKNCIVYSIEWE